MKNKAKGRFAILALAMVVMMVALIMQLGSLTLAEGEAYAKTAASLSTSTMYTTGARGRILDRNGIPLAYDSTSYNVQFYRDPERTSAGDSALYTESLLEAISIIEAGGGTIIDTSYIQMNESGELYYKWGVESQDAIKARYKNFCNVMAFRMKDENDMSQWISAADAYRELRKAWKIPEELPFSEAVKVMSIRQEVNMNKWRAYEPVTIAFNVPMEVVAQLDMRKGELLGIQTVQSTSRVYPWGTTAAHILGYLGRQVTDEMTEDGMQRVERIVRDEPGKHQLDERVADCRGREVGPVGDIPGERRAFLVEEVVDGAGLGTELGEVRFGWMAREEQPALATEEETDTRALRVAPAFGDPHQVARAAEFAERAGVKPGDPGREDVA